MRELIINRIKTSDWLDYLWDIKGRKLGDYEKWLRTLDDDDLLAAFLRVSIQESNLD